jgi:hypothetical protein
MRTIFSGLLLGLLLSPIGCAFGRWFVSDPDGAGPTLAPGLEAGGEGLLAGLSGFEVGGIAAGIAAFVWTFGKTIFRLWKARQVANG